MHVDATTSTNLINRADQALYQAKARGKNQIALYKEERRDTERVTASITGQLKTVSHAGDVFDVQNISKSSLLIHFDKAIPLGTLLHLSLHMPGRKTPIRCETKVSRVAELKKNKVYELGVRIIRASERDRKALHRYIYSLLNKNKKGKQV